jgi:hypothetical protein
VTSSLGPGPSGQRELSLLYFGRWFLKHRLGLPMYTQRTAGRKGIFIS